MDSRSGFDKAKAEAFAGSLLATLNQGALCLMVSVGHRTGLFDAMRELPPATSPEIARRAALDERYVREWLGAMVTARVVEVEPATLRFSLPPEHAAVLTRATPADNMAVVAQYIAVFGGVEDDVVECFRKGGGVPYSRFPRFHEVVAEESAQHALDDGTEQAVLLGEALRVHPQELLEVLLDQPEERGLPRPPRPVDPRTDLHATPTAGGRARRASRTTCPVCGGDRILERASVKTGPLTIQ